MQEYINTSQGEAAAILARATATAQGIEKISEKINQTGGKEAASLGVAEQYVEAFGNIAKKGNTILLPQNGGDVSSMVTQAMSIYGSINKNNENNRS